MFLKFNPFRSLTVGGAVAAVGATLLGHFEPSALSTTAQSIIQGVGVLVGVLGLRNAQAKTVAELGKVIEELARRSRVP